MVKNDIDQVTFHLISIREITRNLLDLSVEERAMKKTGIFFFGLVGLLWIGIADALAQQTYLGVRAGGNRSTARIEVDGVRLTNLSPDLATNFGFVVGHNINDIFGFQFEVAYVRHGVQAEDASGIDLPQLDPNVTLGEVEAFYIDIPILFMVTALPERTFRPRFFAGPVFAFQTKCDASITQGGVTTNPSCSELPVDIKNFDTRFTFGPGLLIDIRPQITFDVAYEQGVLDVVNEAGEKVTYKNNSWLLKLGLQFPLGW